MGPGAGEAEAAAAGPVSAEQAPATAKDTTAALAAAFAESDITSSLRAIGENTIATIHAGYAANAGKLNWSGPLVDAVAAQVLATLNTALNKP